MSELISKTVHELAELLRKKKVSSVELTKEYLSVIRKCDGKLNSYITICDEQALRSAKEADKRLSSGVNLNPLTGVPIALKDIFVTKDIRTTCASKILENYCPPYDGTVVKKLKDAGAVMLGKLNMDEFAMGSSNEYSAFGPVKNPWNLECTPGGSSGGSAAAVAGGLAPTTLGTDTGGSVRQPASFCGVVGMKPTYGRVSRYGIIAFASSLDQVGPITRDVRDLSLVLGAIAGHDVLDSTSINAPVPDYASMLEAPVKGKRIGIPKEYFAEGCDAEIEAAVKNAAKRLEKQGAKPMDISLPHTKFAIPCYYIIAPAEASSNLAKYDGMRFGARHEGAGDPDTIYTKTRAQNFGDEVALRILVGTYVLSSGYYGAYYLKAQKVRTLIKRDFENAFNSCDVILAPVTPTTAFKLGEKRDDPIKMYLNDIFTIPVNLAGLPAISLPCGISKSGLPIGLQLIGKPLDEGGLLNIAYAYEQLEGWHKKVPVNL